MTNVPSYRDFSTQWEDRAWNSEATFLHLHKRLDEKPENSLSFTTDLRLSFEPAQTAGPGSERYIGTTIPRPITWLGE